ncbi:hypothetical protein FALBO_2998 [Fusarium albosuccineum]|uniref:Uncharacterized protein n=1 Tax=Fusarium albosuccineum TaxID=1237068 RepID=A0A8H4PHH8_9HYPO|nr:hypothetical protein FALBO_2998 [Fusarium albosuccineum]
METMPVSPASITTKRAFVRVPDHPVKEPPSSGSLAPWLLGPVGMAPVVDDTSGEGSKPGASLTVSPS